MKPRSILLLYSVLLMTAGYFSLVWIVILMRDVNRLEGRVVFAAKAVETWLLIAAPLFVILNLMLLRYGTFGDTISMSVGALTMVVGLSLGLTVLISILALSRHLAIASGVQYRFFDAVITFFLMGLLYVPLPIAQLHLNRLVRAKLAREALE